MSNVDNALEWADQVADNAPGETHEAVLAAEVRRLRAILEPTPDARELAVRVSRTVERGYWSSESDDVSFTEVVALIAAHDARLLDDAVERAIAWWRKGHPYNYKAHEAELRATIKGAAHE